MYGARMIPLAHGRQEVVVRGTVTEIFPAKPATGIFRWLKEDAPAVVQVRIDDNPYRKLYDLLRQKTEGGGIAQVFRIGWNTAQSMPKKGDRIWATFAYADPYETFFEGAPQYSYKGLVVIENEWDTRPGELVANEPELPLNSA